MNFVSPFSFPAHNEQQNIQTLNLCYFLLLFLYNTTRIQRMENELKTGFSFFMFDSCSLISFRFASIPFFHLVIIWRLLEVRTHTNYFRIEHHQAARDNLDENYKRGRQERRKKCAGTFSSSSEDSTRLCGQVKLVSKFLDSALTLLLL